MGQLQHFYLVLKPAYGKLRTQLYTLNVIQTEQYDEQVICIYQFVLLQKLHQLIKQAHLPLDEILGNQAALFHRPLEEFEKVRHQCNNRL